jgi:DNA-binding CsgD family transcriptional regulator/tetratricopeptide (TPR) repeat protein
MRVRLTWVLTGRSEELRLIEAAISTPDTSGMVICGAAGVGKSRIAREALLSAASKGRETRWAVGSSSARVLPLGAFAAWAGSVVTDTLQLVRGVIDALTRAPPGITVVVGVDDVHLLDEVSIFVLHQIVQRRAAKLVFTVRDGEPIPPGIQDVWKGGQFDRLDLQPLSQGETATLLSATLGGSVDGDAAGRLWRLTRGNILYLRNIVEQEVADGRLARQHGCWRWTGDPIVAPDLVEMIESRIGTLPDSVGDVIDALAVGEPIELGSLTRIAGPGAVEDADTRGLITLEHIDARVLARVGHPLYGEVRRRRAAPTRLRRLRGMVATELADSEDSDDMRTVVRRAALNLDSDLEPDPDLFTRGAQGATWLADLQLAERLADAAIHAGAGAEANIIRGRALTWLGRGQEAEAMFAAIDLADFSDADRARLAYLRAGNMLWALEDPAGAKKLIDEASDTAPPGNRSCIDAFLAVYWASTGKPEAAMNVWRHLNWEQLPAIVAAEMPWAIGIAAGDTGRLAEATAVAEAGDTVLNRYLEAAQMRFANGDCYISALLLAGQIEAARDIAERLHAQAAELPGGVHLLGQGLAGRAALGGGRLDAACMPLQSAVEGLSASGKTGGMYGFGHRYQISYTVALAMRGLIADATATFARLDHQRFASWQFLDWECALAQAWIAASRGEISAAISSLLSAAETARSNARFAVEVILLQTATQFGDRSCVSRLADLEEIVEGPRVGIAARFAAALRADDGAELAAVSKEFERMGDLIAAVDAAAHAAIAYRHAGLRGSALVCSTRADALAEQCGGASTPALGQASQRLPLTAREREVVVLIGEGLSNRAVAERLTVSVRTVETHIYRAMAKTSATSRDQLAALIPRLR